MDGRASKALKANVYNANKFLIDSFIKSSSLDIEFMIQPLCFFFCYANNNIAKYYRVVPRNEQSQGPVGGNNLPQFSQRLI